MAIAEAVTPWRGELQARQTELAQFILAHAEPEAAMRVAQDTAHDLRDAVQRELKQRHGRTFDSLLDYEPPPATYRFRSEPITERIATAVAARPGIAVEALARLPGIAASAAHNILPMLVRQGRLRREGTGNRHDAYRYFPATE